MPMLKSQKYFQTAAGKSAEKNVCREKCQKA